MPLAIGFWPLAALSGGKSLPLHGAASSQELAATKQLNN